MTYCALSYCWPSSDIYEYGSSISLYKVPVEILLPKEVKQRVFYMKHRV